MQYLYTSQVELVVPEILEAVLEVPKVVLIMVLEVVVVLVSQKKNLRQLNLFNGNNIAIYAFKCRWTW